MIKSGQKYSFGRKPKPFAVELLSVSVKGEITLTKFEKEQKKRNEKIK